MRDENRNRRDGSVTHETLSTQWSPHTKGKKTKTTPVTPNRGHLIQGIGHKGMERTRREQRRRRRQEQMKKGEELEVRRERCVHESA